eukprot:TRINITY_DN36320_c0_g1_i1.p2 TRINITY_DN36320_c0_g1~~TRINITY_DN36320_c0_g1_i1.p2  ORF type:complete len:251 (+),score=74.55 TRINITY_DN36320_c0_g1_i1:73-825(+)
MELSNASYLPPPPCGAVPDPPGPECTARQAAEWVLAASDAVLAQNQRAVPPRRAALRDGSGDGDDAEAVLSLLCAVYEEDVLARQTYVRHLFVSLYAFAVPTPAAAAACAACGPLLEVGAGSGFWARALRRGGCDVVAADSGEWKRGAEASPLLRFRRAWSEVEEQGAAEAAAAHPDRVLLFVWAYPGAQWAAEALRRSRAQRCVVVGDPACSADPAQGGVWELERELPLPGFPGIRDSLRVMRRAATHS